MVLKYTFKKEERLCSKKQISLLYNNCSSFLIYPFIVSYRLTNELNLSPAQILFTVSKKKFKRSVDRNLVKRKMKESYRKLKPSILYPYLQQNNFHLILSINYISKEILDYQTIFNKTELVLIKLTKELKNNQKNDI